jgi:hypothetical protein
MTPDNTNVEMSEGDGLFSNRTMIREFQKEAERRHHVQREYPVVSPEIDFDIIFIFDSLPRGSFEDPRFLKVYTPKDPRYSNGHPGGSSGIVLLSEDPRELPSYTRILGDCPHIRGSSRMTFLDEDF